MPANNQYQSIIRAISTAADNANLRVTVRQSGNAAILTGVVTFLGGVLMGPRGLAMGGALGGLTSLYLTQGTFQPLSEILSEMTGMQRQALIRRIRTVLESFDIRNLNRLSSLLTSDADVREKILEAVVAFVRSCFGIEVVGM